MSWIRALTARLPNVKPFDVDLRPADMGASRDSAFLHDPTRAPPTSAGAGSLGPGSPGSKGGEPPPPGKTHLILIGPSGSGKSSVIDAVAAELDSAIDARAHPAADLTGAADDADHRMAFVARPVHLRLSAHLEELAHAFRGGRAIAAHLPAERDDRFPPSASHPTFDPRPRRPAERVASALSGLLLGRQQEVELARRSGDELRAKVHEAWQLRVTAALRTVFREPALRLGARDGAAFVDFPDGRRVPLARLSTGHRAALGIFAEILLRVEAARARAADPFLEPTGVVLIDSPELGLDVRLQRELLPALVRFFGGVQFVVATHSPFVALSLPGSVVLDLASGELRRHADVQRDGLDGLLVQMMVGQRRASEQPAGHAAQPAEEPDAEPTAARPVEPPLEPAASSSKRPPSTPTPSQAAAPPGGRARPGPAPTPHSGSDRGLIPSRPAPASPPASARPPEGAVTRPARSKAASAGRANRPPARLGRSLDRPRDTFGGRLDTLRDGVDRRALGLEEDAAHDPPSRTRQDTLRMTSSPPPPERTPPEARPAEGAAGRAPIDTTPIDRVTVSPGTEPRPHLETVLQDRPVNLADGAGRGDGELEEGSEPPARARSERVVRAPERTLEGVGPWDFDEE